MTSDAGRPSAPEPEAFELGELRGELAPGLDIPDLEGEVRRLADPAAALETLHWGRNYLYRARLRCGEGTIDVAVKQFRHEGFLRSRLRGDKALRSWRMARRFVAAGVPTADPLLRIESTARGGPSFFITRYLDGVVESRYIFRAAQADTLSRDFPQVDYQAFLRAVGRLLRRMHDAGLWHRDLSIGNVLLRLEGAADAEPELFVIDLNRARCRRRVSINERTRDLCRLAIFRPQDQETFLSAYWGGQLTPFGRRLYRLYQRGFLRKIETKKRLRGGTSSLRELFRVRRPHAHIPPPPEGAAARDKVVWDALSDQPHQHASRAEKAAVRLRDLGGHAATGLTAAVAMPRIWRRYRSLRRQLYSLPVDFSGLGVGLRPHGRDPEAQLAALEELGTRRVLLRLHPWQDDHGAEEALARELAGRGYEISFALPQNRELVKDPGRWRAAVEEVAERFLPFGRQFQVGQAINRSKWGIWNYDEYLQLVRDAAEVLRRDPRAEVFGPAVIDFEYHATAAVLNRRAAGVAFDGVSALLYVDRRGAPENRQAGFDTVDKVVLLRAIAETARNVTPAGRRRCWITEFNWPLWEGPHSPAGKDVSVDEERQADYLVRYALLAGGTGLVERIYWWQLVARGYGLVAAGDGGRLRRRPAHRALAALQRQLAGATFLGPAPAGTPVSLYRFRDRQGGEVLAGWSSGVPARVAVPARVVAAFDRDGEEVRPPAGLEVTLGPSPAYLHLENPG